MGMYDGILFAVLVFFMILGFLRGLIKELAVGMLIVIPIIAAMLLSPFLSDFLEKNTKIHAGIEKVLYEKLTDTHKEKDETKASKEAKEKKDSKETDGMKETDETKKTDETKEAKEKEKGNKEKMLEVFSILNKDNHLDTDEIFVKTATERMVKAFSFVTIYLFFYLSLSIVFFALNVFAKLPVLSGFNRFFGSLLGLAKALLFVSVLLLLLPFLYVNVKGTDVILDGIQKSAVLKYLYEHNLILALWRLIVR